MAEHRMVARGRVLALAAAILITSPAAASGLLAGAARVSITPAASAFPFAYDSKRSCEPESTAGRSCNFVGVHDDVYARALMLSDGKRSAVLVMIEATAVPDAVALKAQIAKAAGLAEADILLAATHTHEVLLVNYHGGEPTPAQRVEIERVKTGAIEAVRLARMQLRPARVSFGRGAGWINVNNGDSVGTAGYNPAGPSDKSLDVIRIDGTDGKPVALVVNYASHGEVMYRSVTRNGGYEVSGDIPGAVSRNLEGVAAIAPVVLFSAGAEGDQQALFKSAQHQDGPLPADDQGAAGWALLDAMARRLTLSVADVLKTMRSDSGQAHIGAAAGSATCPGQHVHIDSASNQPVIEAAAPVNIPLNVIRINDIALVGVGGDVGSEIGMAVKNASPVADTTMVTVAAGSVGYVLADSSYARMSHGILGSPLRPDCAQPAIVGGVNALIHTLWPQP